MRDDKDRRRFITRDHKNECARLFVREFVRVLRVNIGAVSVNVCDCACVLVCRGLFNEARDGKLMATVKNHPSDASVQCQVTSSLFLLH